MSAGKGGGGTPLPPRESKRAWKRFSLVITESKQRPTRANSLKLTQEFLSFPADSVRTLLPSPIWPPEAEAGW